MQTVRLLGGALAAAAAVLALVDVAQQVTAAIAGGSAFASYLGQQQFAQNAAKDYAAAGGYKELAERYDSLCATLPVLSIVQGRAAMDELSAMRGRIHAEHASA